MSHQLNVFLPIIDNMTEDEVKPTLDKVAADLVNVEGAIASAKDMTEKLSQLQKGYDQVSFYCDEV